MLLHHLAALPPLTATEILQTLGNRVLYSAPALAPRLQAEPFGDAALAQVCRHHGELFVCSMSLFCLCLLTLHLLSVDLPTGIGPS